MVHLQTLSHFVQEVKGRGDDDLSPALISQDSLNGNAHQVFLPLPPQKPCPFLRLINQLVSMAHLFYKLLLTYHMLSIRHDAGPWGASHPMGKVWLRNKKCHKALQICIGWQMLEAYHPHIWKKYALQHFLNNVFPPKLCKSTQQSRAAGDDGVPVLPWELLRPSSLQLGDSLFLLHLHGRRACRAWGPISPCVTPVNGITLFESGLEEGPNQPVREVRAEDLVRCGELNVWLSSWRFLRETQLSRLTGLGMNGLQAPVSTQYIRPKWKVCAAAKSRKWWLGVTFGGEDALKQTLAPREL